MTPSKLKAALVGVLALLLISAGGVWKVQDWNFGMQLAEQAGLHKDELGAISNAAAAQLRADQVKRLALEQRLSATDKTHQETLTNAQKDEARLRDRLATSDLRLSVLLDARGQAVVVQCQPVPAPPAWFMEEHAPNLTQRMLNELSTSPTSPTKD